MSSRAQSSPAIAPQASFSISGKVRQAWYNVRDFGAKGDNSTDDTAAIQAAIDALPTSGGTVFFPHGIYLITNTLYVKKHAVTLRGTDYSTNFTDIITFQQPNMTGDTVIQATLDGSWPAGATMIQFGELGTSKMWVSGSVHGLIVNGCKGHGTPGNGIDIFNMQAVRIWGNGITQLAKGVNAVCDLGGGGMSNCDVEFNIMYYFTNIGIHYDTGMKVNYARFNYIVNCQGNGIRSDDAGNGIIQNHIEGTLLHGSGTHDGAAICVTGAGNFIFLNDSPNSEGDGIYLSGDHSSVSLNSIEDPNTTSQANGAGIRVDGNVTKMSIVGNNIKDFNSKMIYGIYDTTSGTKGVHIDGNAIEGFVTAEIASTGNGLAPSILPAGVGAGVLVPTAYAHLAAATTSKASLRINSGTAPTSPNDGDIWYDGTNLKIRVGGSTKTFTLT